MAKTNNLTDFLTSLALKFRAKLGTSGTINPQDFESKVDDVFDAGKTSEYDAFWDSYQKNGTRIDYACAFAGSGWTRQNLLPKYALKPSDAYMMFANSTIEDLSLPFNGITLDFSNAARLSTLCSWSAVQKLPKITIGNRVNNYTSAFMNANKLKTITELAFPTSSALLGTDSTATVFYNCTALENITVTGTIMNTGFDLHWSTKLTIESVTSILTALSKDSSVASGKTITLPLSAKEKLDSNLENTADAQTQYNLALSAGWTISFA